MERETRAKKKMDSLCNVFNGPGGGNDVGACKNDNCRIQWFHVGCVGFEDSPVADDVWFCPPCSAIFEKTLPGLFMYTA